MYVKVFSLFVVGGQRTLSISSDTYLIGDLVPLYETTNDYTTVVINKINMSDTIVIVIHFIFSNSIYIEWVVEVK